MALNDFNLLISTSRGYETDACSEVWFLLGEIGDKEPKVEKSDVAGLIVAKTVLNPFNAIQELRKLLKERPWEFRYTLRFVPIEVVIRTDLERIKEASQKLSSKIGMNETFRVTVEKRYTNLSTNDVIKAAAEGIERKVDLANPNRILLIEILGGLTGISIIKPEDILSVTKEKSLSVE
jgi:tRNA acetyltransferase TAN1